MMLKNLTVPKSTCNPRSFVELLTLRAYLGELWDKQDSFF